MKLLVLTVGKSSAKWADTAIADWTKRMRRYGGLEAEWVKHHPFRGDVDAVRDAEAERLLKRIGPRDVLVAVDERGDTPTSHALADWFETQRVGGTHRVVFAIGGAYGHGAEVRERANKVLSLSSFVLNHEVARVVLIEQIYRSFTILNGVPYHH
ncbi:MAG: 23S rRNA (pseudouridine(1915)-N(3))-methyltransferase RlmH [Proteobacteria bacterium]|nr:23S rRNA (pseudouridine(1915)-N(3))-methyltransferase RlmH [Pseudomonadota bacterium]